jgi:RNA polymerase sigma factor (sigma-70 family)
VVSYLDTLGRDEVGDRQLLLNFAGAADQSAFAQIVHRHGKLVFGVCRRLLGAGPDSDDAFQATFLVLARKASSIRKPNALASWLYGVAYRIAGDLQKQRSRRRQRESAAPASLEQIPEEPSRHTDPGLQASRREVASVVDEELTRLPAGDRDALVACLMQGMSHSEAARHLGWPLGTLKSRIEHGRQLLRERLERRGLALSSLAVSVLLREQIAVAVPPALAARALQVVTQRAGSAQVLALAGQAMRSLAAGKLRLIGLGLLTACLVGFGAAAFALRGERGEPANNPPESGQTQANEPLQDHQLAAAPNLPAGAIAGFGAIPFHNGSRIEASEISPDGKRLATLGKRSATVWDLASGARLHRFFFEVPAMPAFDGSLAFSPDGKRLACRPSKDQILVWDLTDGKQVRRFAVEQKWVYGFSFLRFSADGKALIAQVDEDVAWLNIATGAIDPRLPRVRLKQLSPDDKTFIAVDEGKRLVHIGDAATGKITHALPVGARPDRMEQGVLFLPDGVTLAVINHQKRPGKDAQLREVQFWDRTTGKRRDMTWGLPDETDGRQTYRLTHSADGKVLYFPEDHKNIRRFSLTTGKELEPMPVYGAWTTAVFPHPDGKTLFSVQLDQIRRWDLATGSQTSRDADFLDWWETAISPNGRWLALGALQGPLELRDVESGKVKRIDYAKSNGRYLVFSPDSNVLAINNYDHIHFLRVPELTEIKKLKKENDVLGAASIHYSQAGRYLAFLTSTGHLRVVDLSSDKEIWSLGEIWKALFTANGNKMFVLPRGGSVLRLYEIATHKVVFEFDLWPEREPGRRVGNLAPAWALSPDGRILAVAKSSGHVLLLDTATGKERSRFLSMATDQAMARDGDYRLHPTALAFSADGQWLAAGGQDSFVRIWEVNTRRELHRLHGHEWETVALAFSADGRRLLSFGGGEAILWDLRPGRDSDKTEPLTDLLSADGHKVYAAMWKLAADPAAPARLRQIIPPGRVDARPERITKLIADLDSGRFTDRDAAQRALEKMEGHVRPALQSVLDRKPSLETERRIRKLLAARDDDPGPNQLRILRAVRVLELQGRAAARQVLREWSEGSSGLRLTEEARAALARLPR